MGSLSVNKRPTHPSSLSHYFLLLRFPTSNRFYQFSVEIIMSTRPGSHLKKKPGQKHKNVSTFKFDKYRTDPQAKSLKSLQVVNCCPRHRSHRMEDQVREVQDADHASQVCGLSPEGCQAQLSHPL